MLIMNIILGIDIMLGIENIMNITLFFPYDRRSVSVILQPSPFFPKLYLIFQLLIIKNGTNKKSVEKLSKNELIDEVLSLENSKNDINVKFSKLNDHFNNFEAKCEMVNSN